MDYHIPVLYREVIDNLVINPDGIYVDCTMGGGGHSEGIAKALGENGRLVAIDQDDEAIKFASERLEPYKDKIKIFRDNFKNIDTVLFMAGYDKVDGILMDIGVSSKQIDDDERGFAYRAEGRLDMRMDRRQKLSAYEVVNQYDEEKLAHIIYVYGEERFSRKIAKFIVERRAVKPIETTMELADIIERAVSVKSNKHPARRTFQAIRIEVNNELDILKESITKSVKLLKKGGRLAIITFHSLEDRIVKEMFKEMEKTCVCPPTLPVCICNKVQEVKIITRKPIVPSEKEVKDNFRAHSSKLRIAERM